jgi:hypothetical protein
MKNNNLTPDSIRQHLNHSAAQMDSDTVESLRASRNLALERHRALQHAPVQAWLTHHGLWAGGSHSHHKHVYLALAVLLSLCLYSGAVYLQHDRDHADTTDIELLTDDVPVDAYAD